MVVMLCGHLSVICEVLHILEASRLQYLCLDTVWSDSLNSIWPRVFLAQLFVRRLSKYKNNKFMRGSILSIWVISIHMFDNILVGVITVLAGDPVIAANG